MNRAVELAPNSVRVRLVRAFNGLNLPDALRNHAAEAEDLDFLIKVAGGSRPGDYLHIMRGDLYFELGKLDLARSQYEIASKSASPAASEATERLTALTQGGVAIDRHQEAAKRRRGQLRDVPRQMRRLLVPRPDTRTQLKATGATI